jgi:rubrerythrin
MSTLKGSETHENLKRAFAAESQANRRYLYFARAADIEGYPEVGGLFRDTSEAETYEYTQMYPGMARTAREEGHPEIAEWFETLAKAERSHAGRFTKGLEALRDL